MSPDKLVKFEKPPVVETVLGVQFDRIRHLKTAHLGVFWKRLGSYWCKVDDAPSIEPQIEKFGEKETWTPSGIRWRVSPEADIRLQLRNEDRDRMVQIQNGRLHYNWLGHSGSDYPSYDEVRPEFDKILKFWQDFLQEEFSDNQDVFAPNQWEVTYVNRISKGTVWDEPNDWSELFCGIPTAADLKSPVSLESFGGEWHYEIEPRRGRLHVKIGHEQRLSSSNDGSREEFLALTLTARGTINSEEGRDLDTCLKLGHDTIVNSFVAITSERAHRYWGGPK